MRRLVLLFLSACAVQAFSGTIFAQIHNYALTPQVVVGGGYETVVMVSNTVCSFQGWSGTAYLFSGQQSASTLLVNGQPVTQQGGSLQSGLGALNYGFTVNPPCNGTQKYVITTTQNQAISGDMWIIPQTNLTADDLSIAALYNFYSNGKLVSSTGSPLLSSNSDAGPRFAFPVELSDTVDTGLAMEFPFSAVPAQIDLYDAKGNQIATKSLNVARYVGFFDQLFPKGTIPSPFVGFINVRNTFTSLFLVAIRIQNNPDGTSFMTNIPAKALPF